MSEILIFLGINTSKKEVRFLDERLKSKIFKYKDKKDLENKVINLIKDNFEKHKEDFENDEKKNCFFPFPGADDSLRWMWCADRRCFRCADSEERRTDRFCAGIGFRYSCRKRFHTGGAGTDSGRI